MHTFRSFTNRWIEERRFLLGSIKKQHNLLLISTLGIVQLLLYGHLRGLGDLRKVVPAFLLDYCLIFAAYIIVIILCRRQLNNGASPSHIALLIFPLLFRIIMAVAQVALSTDIMRYMWDGMLLGNGIDPYMYVPSSPALLRFRSVYYYQAYDHKDEFTVYPPIAQYFFGACYLLFGNSEFGFKSMAIVFDVLNALLIAMVIMRLRDRPQAYFGAALYLWNPLVVLEFSGSGHIDALAIFFSLLGVYFLSNSSASGSFVSLVSSSIAKWVTMPLAPLYVKYFMKRESKHVWKTIVSVAIVLTVSLLPFYLTSRLGFMTSMIRFVSNWRFESALSRLLAFVLAPTSDELIVLKVISYTFFVGSYLITLFKNPVSSVEDVIEHSVLILSLLYLIMPAVYPWYGIWLLVYVSLLKNGFKMWVSVLFTGIVVVNYLQQFYQLSGVQFWAVYILWYIPVLFMLLSYLAHSSILKRLHGRSS